MSIKHVVLLISLVVLLVACASREERQARVATEDRNTCLSWGTSIGSAAYVECRRTLVDNRARTDAQNRAAWAGVTNLGVGIYNSAQPPAVYAPPAPRTYDTNCYNYGTDVQCRTTGY